MQARQGAAINKMDALDQKLNSAFDGKVVRKDLLHRIKKGTNVPTFVLEFLLAKYCASNDPDEIQAGMEAVLATLPGLADKSLPEMLKAIGLTLVMKVGGASGPLVGTFFMELGKALPERPARADLVAAADKAIDAVKTRGRSEAGQKTLLDVLVPVQAVFAGGGDAKAIAAESAQAADRTTPMLATRGRASFLGERSIGHMDPGSRSASLLISAAIAALEFEATS